MMMTMIEWKKGITKMTRGRERRRGHSRFQTPIDDEKGCGGDIFLKEV
jgi:hypothetical protein